MARITLRHRKGESLLFRHRAAKNLIDEATSILRDANGYAARERANECASQAAALTNRAKDAEGARIWAAAATMGAEHDFERGQIDMALAVFVAAASIYSRHENEPDRRDYAKLHLRVANVYSLLGNNDKAASLAVEGFRQSGDSRNDLDFRLDVSRHLIQAECYPPVRSLLEPLADGPQARSLSASLIRILLHLSGARDLDESETRDVIFALERVSPQMTGLARVALARSLSSHGADDEARTVLEEHLQLLNGQGVPWWQTVRLTQSLAGLALGLGDTEGALQRALDVWVCMDSIRYLTGSVELRATIQRSFSRARQVALDCAVALEDWTLLDELLEASRIQAFPDLPGSRDQLRQVIGGGSIPPGVDPSIKARHVELGDLTQILQSVYDDVVGQRLDIGPMPYRSEALFLAAQRLVATVPSLTDARLNFRTAALLSDEVVWRTWVEAPNLYWTTNIDNQVLGGSLNCQSNGALVDALTVCCEAHGHNPFLDRRHDGHQSDLFDCLLRADLPEELEVTRALLTLLPAPLRDRAVTASHGLPLVVHAYMAPELAIVPWAILPLEESGSQAVRLVERMVLLDVFSAATNSSVPVFTDGRPLRLVCDYVPEDVSHLIRPDAVQTLSRGSQGGITLATSVNLASALVEFDPGSKGTAFFRAHFRAIKGSPGDSGLELIDGAFPAGMLFARDEGLDRSVLGLPERVVFSCCSSAGFDRNGGESLGLAAGALASGARFVIATRVDVINCAFTNAWDEMLIDTLVETAAPTQSLYQLQLRMLDEWRLYSLRGIYDVEGEDIRDPLPIIWAYYTMCVREGTQ